MRATASRRNVDGGLSYIFFSLFCLQLLKRVFPRELIIASMRKTRRRHTYCFDMLFCRRRKESPYVQVERGRRRRSSVATRVQTGGCSHRRPSSRRRLHALEGGRRGDTRDARQGDEIRGAHVPGRARQGVRHLAGVHDAGQGAVGDRGGGAGAPASPRGERGVGRVGARGRGGG